MVAFSGLIKAFLVLPGYGHKKCPRSRLFLTLLLIGNLIGGNLIFSVEAQAENSLRFGVITTFSMPIANVFMDKKGHHIGQEGRLYQLGQQLADTLSLKIEYVPVPREDALSFLMSGEVDTICYMTPQWLGAPPSSVAWTDPILKTRDILISRQGRVAPIRTLKDLKGLNIGLVRHYHYPLIDDFIKRQLLFPVYANSEQANFFQLFKNEGVDAIVFKDLTFDYLFNELEGSMRSAKILKHPLVIEFVEPRCAVSLHKPWDLTQINKAIKRYTQQQK